MKKVWLILLVVSVLIMAIGCANKYKTSGKIAMKSKSYEKAIHDFTMALESTPSDPELHYLVGDAYRRQGDYLAMSQHFDEASRLSPKYDEQIQIARDSIWFDLFTTGTQKAKEAGEKKTQAMSDTTQAPGVWIGIFTEALKDFQLATRINPKRYEAYTNAGYVFQNMVSQDTTYIDSAYAYYMTALDLDRSNTNLLINVVNLLVGMGRFETADSISISILEKDPNNIDALIRRGEIADQQGRYDDAVIFYNKALQIDASLNDVWFNLGVVYFQHLKKMEDAEQAFTRAIELEPKDFNAQINLFVALITNNKLDDAIVRLNTFTSENPTQCVGWDLLSQALLRKGNKNDAYAANKKYEDCKAQQ